MEASASELSDLKDRLQSAKKDSLSPDNLKLVPQLLDWLSRDAHRITNEALHLEDQIHLKLKRLRSEAAHNHLLVDLLCGPTGALQDTRPELLESVARELKELRSAFAAVARAFRGALPLAQLYDGLADSTESFNRRAAAGETASECDTVVQALEAYEGNMRNVAAVVRRAWSEPANGGSLEGVG